MNYYVVCFINDGFDEVLTGPRTKKSAQKLAKKFRAETTLEPGSQVQKVQFKVCSARQLFEAGVIRSQS